MFVGQIEMRKLKLQMQVTVDGFVAGPNGEQDWMVWDWDEKLKDYVAALTETVDTMVMGRVLYEGMAKYWPAAAENAKDPNAVFARKMNKMRKFVFTKTLTSFEWENTQRASGTIGNMISRLKSDLSSEKDIIVYGGARFVSSLIEADLIDEYHLFVNPIAIGEGMSIFRGLEEKRKLQLINVTTTRMGITVFHYVPNRENGHSKVYKTIQFEDLKI